MTHQNLSVDHRRIGAREQLSRPICRHKSTHQQEAPADYERSKEETQQPENKMKNYCC